MERVERDSDGLISKIDGRPSKVFVHDLGERRALEFRDARTNGEVSRTKVGEVTAVALDRRTGEIFEATNGKRKNVVEDGDAHPLMADRVSAMKTRGEIHITNKDYSATAEPRWHPHPDEPLGHAEVKAVNELLHKRGMGIESSVFGEITVDTFAPFDVDGVWSRPYCANCSILLEGTSTGAGRFTGYPPSDVNYRME